MGLSRHVTPAVSISILVILAAFGIYWLAGDTLVQAIQLVLQVGAVSVATVMVAVSLISILYLAWVAYQKGWAALEARRAAGAQRRLIEAESRVKEREAEVMVITAKHDEQIIIRDEGHTLWRKMHLEPRVYVNGTPTLPTPLEVALWQNFHGQKGFEVPQVFPQLPAGPVGALPERIDLPQLLPSGRGSLRSIIVGVRLDEQGQLQTVSLPLARMVHVGAAGATDSGKSNFGRVIGVQVATVAEDVSLVFVDLKQTTFKIFRDVPRLRYPLVTTPGDFLVMMDDLAGELERRKHLFKSYLTVETLADYNKVAAEPLPVIIVFVDEVTNLFLDNHTRRIALRMICECRAFGINFITLGQSWSHKEMDTSFREQHRTTGHFGTNNPHSSRMMLNSPDAINITLPGRAYFALPFGISRGIVEIQTPYLDPDTALRLLPATTHPLPPLQVQSEQGTGVAPTAISQHLKPTEQERRVLELAAAGESHAKICETVWGYKSSKLYQRIDAILEKFGIVHRAPSTQGIS
jgi:hypothetical protein